MEKADEIQKDFTTSMQKEFLHIPYNEEMRFYEMVRQGDTEALEKINPQLLVEGQGILSNDKIRNAKYHFIIATAFIARFCIEGGLQKEEVYTLSDVFIRRMDILSDIEDLKKLHHEMVFGFAEKMKAHRKTFASSLYIRSAIDYISANLSKPLKLKDIANHLGISEKYLTVLFKKETGYTIANYIEERQMESARRMLCYTSMSYADIADSLSFCSQSYFSKIFKKHHGITPMQYRMKNSNKKFLKDSE